MHEAKQKTNEFDTHIISTVKLCRRNLCSKSLTYVYFRKSTLECSIKNAYIESLGECCHAWLFIEVLYPKCESSFGK